MVGPDGSVHGPRSEPGALQAQAKLGLDVGTRDESNPPQ